MSHGEAVRPADADLRDAGPIHFSVCIPVYNDAALLPIALDGVLAQTYRAWELVISDNASTDDVAAVLDRYDDPRIRYVRWADHVSSYESHNRAVSLGRNDWLVPLGADDRLATECLARLAEAIGKHHGSRGTLALALTACRRIDPSGESADTLYYGRGGAKHVISGTYSAREWLAIGARAGAPPWNIGSVAISRDAMIRSGSWFRTDVGLSADNELFFRLAAFGDVSYIAEPLLDYMVRSNSDGNRWFAENRRRGERETPLGAALVSALAAHASRRPVSTPERRAIFGEVARLHVQRAGHHRVLPGGRGVRGAALDVLRAVRAAPTFLAHPARLLEATAIVLAPTSVLRWASTRTTNRRQSAASPPR